MGVEVKWSGVRSNRLMEMRLSKKGPKVETKSGGIMTIMCKVGLKVNLMWGGNKG